MRRSFFIRAHMRSRARSLLNAIIATCLSALGAHAHAGDEPPAPLSPPGTLDITPPPGVSQLPGLSGALRSRGDADALFEERSAGQAIAWGRADRIAFYLTWTQTESRPADGPAAIRAAFQRIHQSPRLASPQAGSTREVEYRERLFDDVAELRFEWAHLSNETVSLIRALAWIAPDKRVHLARVECVYNTDAVERARPDCQAALESLRLTESAQRIPLDRLPEAARPEEVREDPRFPLGDESSTLAPAPSIGPAQDTLGPVLHEEPPETRDHTDRIFLVVGIALLGLAFYLTTRRRTGERDAGGEVSPEAQEATPSGAEAEDDNERSTSD